MVFLLINDLMQSTTKHLDRVQQENSSLNERICTIQNSRGHSSLLNEMECDDDAGIDLNRSSSSNSSILIEARAVYNELKRLHYTLKGNHDGDSGIIEQL